MRSRDAGAGQLVCWDAGLERPGETRVNRAWMQADADRERISDGKLDAQCSDDLIERRL